MTAVIYSAVLNGIDALPVQVETRICAGMGYFIIGLPGEAVKESLFRVESALTTEELQMPRQKILISLAPAGVRKEGATFDLPIALGILVASGQLAPEQLDGFLFTGELSLTGRLRPVKGALSMAIEAGKAGMKNLVLPKENAAEAAMVSGLNVFGCTTLTEVIGLLQKPDNHQQCRVIPQTIMSPANHTYRPDFSDVRGQAAVKRALEIMAAGGHNGLMIGPPGSGKTMLASRLPGILPPLSFAESLDVTRIWSVAGKLEENGLMTERPFRSPHHTASDISLVGGGPVAMPGEISLAHHGVLFLDELPEYKRKVLEVLRQPLEERQIAIARASYSVLFPANFVLLAAMNPCPCGFFRHPDRKCTCTPQAIRNYRSRISGPLLDRIDLHIAVQPVRFNEQPSTASSQQIRDRVSMARQLQTERAGVCNAQMSAPMLTAFCGLDTTGTQLLEQAMVQHQLSARSYDRILKVARTIADLAGSAEIRLDHLAEAISLRCFDHEIVKA